MKQIPEWKGTQVRGFYVASLLLTSLLCIGTFGFSLIEGWGLLDSFYMTVITISTVGYREVHPLSTTGTFFTIGLIISGMSVAVYAFTVIGRAAIEGELFELRRMRRMEKAIAEIRDHTIICGFGSLAHYITNELQSSGQEVVVIDENKEATLELKDLRIPFVYGNAHDDETLISAGIQRAQALIAILPSDADNVYVTLSARSLNPNLRIVASSKDLASESKLSRAGADHVISPYRVNGNRIVQQLLHQNVNDFLEIATAQDGQKLVVEQIVLPEASPLIGQTIQNSEVRKKAGVSIAAIMSSNRGTNLNPGKDELFEAGDTLIVVGSNLALKKLNSMVSG